MKYLPTYGPRALANILLPGIAMIVLWGSVPYEAAGPHPLERNWVFGRLDREHSFGQTFAAGRAPLVAIRVLLFPSVASGDELITLRLRRLDDATPDLAVVTLPARELAREGMTTFRFPPVHAITTPHAVTETLRLEIAAPDIPPDRGISVIAGRDTYGAGELLVNGRPRPSADLAFQPIYEQRRIDALFPVTRLADGKPGMVGWPLWYALVASVYICALAVALSYLWQVRAR